MNTTEGNKLIAEFMGGILWTGTRGGELDKIKMTETTFPDQMFTCKIADLQYHTSWDWLMPVVEKIEGISGVGAVVISRDHCWISSDKEPLTYENEIVHPDLCQPNKKEAVYSAVLQFIQWYNQNNKV